MKKIVLMSLVASSVLMASGYKIPENSLNAVALSAANVAHSSGADAAYYNPANMVFMADENAMQADLTYIGLDAVKYKGTVGPFPQDIESESEDFLVPSLHYVSGNMSGARFGLSVVSPGGLSKRWNNSLATYSAEEFTLETAEINPTIALPIGDKIGVAIGFRIVHSAGVAKASGLDAVLGAYSQDMTGDSIDFGYNLALAYKPTSEVEIGLTYRSHIDLTVEGTAELHSSLKPVNGTYDGSLTVPLPAALSIAAAYTLPTKTTIEFVYERAYWSAYEEINFNYSDPAAEGYFGTAKPKNWSDVNTFRLGVTQELDKMTLMAGMVYGETPVPDKTLGFELPDSDSFSVSLGGRYQINEKMDVGLAALYSMRDSREITAADNNDNGLVGEFTEGNILMISAGIGYKF